MSVNKAVKKIKKSNKKSSKQKSTRSGKYGYVPRTSGMISNYGEKKIFDSQLSETNIPDANPSWNIANILDPQIVGPTNILNLCSPTSGAALNQRVGRKIHVHKIKINGWIAVNAQQGNTISPKGTQVRYGLFQDKQTNGAQASAGDVFQSSVTGQNSMMDHQNPNNFGRFRVLKDKRIGLNYPGVAALDQATDIYSAPGILKPFKIHHTFKNPVEVNFNATNGGTVADIVDNSFHFFAAARFDTGAESLCQASYNCRVVYSDL